MIKDKKYVEHGCDLEKVLGYKYNTKNDTIQISNSNINFNVNTKRGVLAQISKVFDPLSLCLPVTLNGKLLMRLFWEHKDKWGWDKGMSRELHGIWSSLSKDMARLNELRFPRHAVDSDNALHLYVFTDASPKAYGFVAYGVQNNSSCIVYAKAKVAPMKKKSLPTLELLGVYLSIKSLSFLLKAYSNVKNIFISVDAQVVISWLLSGINRTNKNLFARNRLKDITQMINDIKDKYSININFKYVPSSENPADMLSRGLTFDKFKQNLDYWIEGPKWLITSPVIWPSSDLNCLNEKSKDIINSSVFLIDHNSDKEKKKSEEQKAKDKALNKMGKGDI